MTSVSPNRLAIMTSMSAAATQDPGHETCGGVAVILSTELTK